MKENLIHYRTCVCNINYHMVSEIPEGDIRQETFRMFSGNKKQALERGAAEPFLLCGNGRICIGRKHPQVYRTSEQSLLIDGGEEMLLSKKTSIKVSREYANLIGHMCYAASKLWNEALGLAL